MEAVFFDSVYTFECTDTKDDEEETVEDTKEMACMPGYDMLSEREKKVSVLILVIQHRLC